MHAQTLQTPELERTRLDARDANEAPAIGLTEEVDLVGLAAEECARTGADLDIAPVLLQGHPRLLRRLSLVKTIAERHGGQAGRVGWVGRWTANPARKGDGYPEWGIVEGQAAPHNLPVAVTTPSQAKQRFGCLLCPRPLPVSGWGLRSDAFKRHRVGRIKRSLSSKSAQQDP